MSTEDLPGPLGHIILKQDGTVEVYVDRRAERLPRRDAVTRYAYDVPPSMRGHPAHPIVMHRDWGRPTRPAPPRPRTFGSVIANRLRRMAQRLDPLERP